MQTLKNLHIMSDGAAGSLKGFTQSIKGYLQVSYFIEAHTCQTLKSIYYYQLDTCHRSGDPDAVAEYIKITIKIKILREKHYHLQWAYYKDSQCSPMMDYPDCGSLKKQVCYHGASIDLSGKIPQSLPSSQLPHNSLLLLLFPHTDTCTTRNPMFTSQALFTSTNTCLYNYYHYLMYKSCNGVNLSGQMFGSKDGSCTRESTPFTRNQSDDINLVCYFFVLLSLFFISQSTYKGYYHFVCFN
jgi:hypothetical protein